MLRKLTVLTLAAALVVAGAAPAYAQRGGRGGGRGIGGGGGRGVVGGGGYRGGYGGGYRNDGFRGFGTGLAIGAGIGALSGYGGYGGYYGSSGYYSDPSYYSTAPVYVDPGYTNGYVVPSAGIAGPATNSGYMSAYPQTPVNQNTALINMHVPANAKVFFGDAAASTTQTGIERQFVSPALEPGSNYQYVLRAEWNENGKTIDRTRTVAVHANDVVNVDFMKAN